MYPTNPEVFARALDARDPRFDGVFFVGITTTRVYCRPVCPARVAYHDHRRFFNTAAAAEHAGFRPCLRCRPELAPGRAVVDAVSRLAQAAAQRIGAGGLNGRSVADLAGEFGVSERHLRRALEREIGVSPSELAQTHRLLLAKRLLVDTGLPVTRIAYASGFQSLRRFNAAFREQYRMPPSALRRRPLARRAAATREEDELIPLTLAYRAPFEWDGLLGLFRGEAIPGIELVNGRRYGRTVRIKERSGFIFAENLPLDSHMRVEISASLLPDLMPLIAQLRRLFDLDMEPTVVDAHLEQGGLGALVMRRPGMRIPGTFDGFEVVLRSMLFGRGQSVEASRAIAARIAAELGDPIAPVIPGLRYLAPTAARVADAGEAHLVSCGMTRKRAAALATVARAVANGELRLEPGGNVAATLKTLLEIDGVGERLATTIVMRTLYWPDAFPASDPVLQRAAGVAGAAALKLRAERWRPWRAYAALHLWLVDKSVTADCPPSTPEPVRQ